MQVNKVLLELIEDCYRGTPMDGQERLTGSLSVCISERIGEG